MKETNYKYTSEGQKVVVIGALNAQETIVQEVFIIGENEVPSGENFVVKSLHDAPAISWKEKHIKEIEHAYKTKQDRYDKDTKRLEEQYYKTRDRLTAATSYLNKVINHIDENLFQTLIDFLNGDIKYVVRGDWNLGIMKWSGSENCEYWDEQIKLLTLFGKDDGTMTWRLNQYSDGSGSNRMIYPCKSFDEAVDKLQELVDAKTSYSDSILKLADKYNLTLDPEKVSALKEERLKGLNKRLIEYKESVTSTKEAIKEANKL